MQRGWYLRLLLMLSVTVAAWTVLWPSLGSWLPSPAFVRKIVSGRISPGLDIRGGLRLTYDVDIGEAVRDRRDLRADEITRELGERLGLIQKGQTPTREQFAKVKEKVSVKPEGDRRIRFSFKSAADAKKLDHELVGHYGDLREVSGDDEHAVLEVRTDFLEQIQDTAVQQARETIENRVDGLGLREASVTAQNTDIIVEVPGANQAVFDRIRQIISKTARLEFLIVDDDASFVADLKDSA